MIKIVYRGDVLILIRCPVVASSYSKGRISPGTRSHCINLPSTSPPYLSLSLRGHPDCAVSGLPKANHFSSSRLSFTFLLPLGFPALSMAHHQQPKTGQGERCFCTWASNDG